MKLPDFSFEKEAWEQGFTSVIGVDEVGRGSFAGPVIAACAAMKIFNFQFPIFNEKKRFIEILNLGINDSKKLMARRREELDKEIRKFFHVGIGESSVSEINRYGIVKATEKAMRRAIANLKLQKNLRIFLLVDGFRVKNIKGIGLKNQKAIIRGDSLSISIAAASIVAKVYRDACMETLSEIYTLYHWVNNKGYGTKDHTDAIYKYGICKYHRTRFIQSWKKNISTKNHYKII